MTSDCFERPDRALTVSVITRTEPPGALAGRAGPLGSKNAVRLSCTPLRATEAILAHRNTMSADEEDVPEAAVAVVSLPKEPASPQADPSPLFENMTAANSASNKDEEDRRNARRELYWILSLATIVVLIVVVTISVIATSGRRKNRSASTRAPTAAPTLAPTMALGSAQDVLDMVREELRRNSFTQSYVSALPNSAAQLRSSDSSPSILQATHWLVRQDELVDQKNIIRRLTLATIYHENGGAGWRNSTNWLSNNKHHCDWFGVICCRHEQQKVAPSCVGEDPDTVVELNLSINQLTGRITPIFALATDLRRLDLSYNELTGMPKKVGRISFAHEKRASHPISRSFAGTIPSQELGSLPTLMSLSLQHNQLSGELDEALRQNGVLRTYDLMKDIL